MWNTRQSALVSKHGWLIALVRAQACSVLTVNWPLEARRPWRKLIHLFQYWFILNAFFNMKTQNVVNKMLQESALQESCFGRICLYMGIPNGMSGWYLCTMYNFWVFEYTFNLLRPSHFWETATRYLLDKTLGKPNQSISGNHIIGSEYTKMLRKNKKLAGIKQTWTSILCCYYLLILLYFVI